MSQPVPQSHWSQLQQPEQTIDTMAAVPEHDFDSLLDFGDIELDFPMYDNKNDHHLSSLNESLQPQHLSSAAVSPSHQRNDSSQRPSEQVNTTTGDFFDFSFQSTYPQHNDFSMSEQMMRQRAAVPPTPNSVEMRGDAARYLQQLDSQTRAVVEQRYQLRKDDMASFTPLVSPAVTPHESNYQMQPEFTVPGAYFSPLTSPALEAQNRDGMHRAHYSQPHTANTSMTTSPINLDMDTVGNEESQPKAAGRSKSRKNGSSTRASAQTTRIRQSPIVKPHNSRQRGRLSSVVSSREVHELLEEAQKSNNQSRPASAGLGRNSSREGSENASISPEPLSESLMGPPPKPGSVTASPSIQARGSQKQPPIGLDGQGQAVCPATPASLMRMQPSPQTRPNSGSQHGTPTFVGNGGSQSLNDDFALPEPAAPAESSLQPLRPTVSRSDTVIRDDDSTPRMGPARKTPKLGPLSTPSGPLPSSLRSPSVSSTASPLSATGKKFDLKPAPSRSNKKRGSISSARVSPALRPKISPSIKPLLPDGAAKMTEETHALLLASKSNYQNILEGTHVPGVSYPEDLSTNLTSKRTSHKLAEQGRRNRINLALQELQSLIPSPGIQPKDAAKTSAANASASPEAENSQKKEERQSNSKASTVENAIDYIKLLKKRDIERHQHMLQQQKEIDQLRRRLAAGSLNSKTANIDQNNEYTTERHADGSQNGELIETDKASVENSTGDSVK
ncbi:hypothetical protein IWX49DRAFT_623224 [Phyllosticta citricarpa]|uniref:BHLH domain-containing protein n=2 Tax=Phyllosticta TaxID=121621 RepID=A0ABR1MQN5_9PEZI